MPKKHTINSLSVWLDKAAVQQAFTTLAARIIEAGVVADRYGRAAASDMYGDEESYYPMSGEVVIGRVGGLVVKMEIEPDKSGWAGEHLTHEEINAIGISDMIVDGQSLKPKGK